LTGKVKGKMNNKILLRQIPLGLGFGLFLLLVLSTVAGAQDKGRTMPTEVPQTRNAGMLTAGPNDCNPKRDLAGNISGGSGTVQNNSTSCSYVVGMASYRKFDEIYDNQILFDTATAQIQPGQTLTLSVSVPDCAAQIDLFFGPPLADLKGKRYGDRLLAWLHTSQPYCALNPPQPPATTVAPTTSVPTTPAATTVAPTTPPATTVAPTTPPATTAAPTTAPGTTSAPVTTVAPTTPAVTTAPATTSAPATTATVAPTTPSAVTVVPTAPANTPVATNVPSTTPAANAPAETNTPATGGSSGNPSQPENPASAEVEETAVAGAEETAVAGAEEGESETVADSEQTAVLSAALPAAGTGGTNSGNGSFALWLIVGLFLTLSVASGSLVILKKRI
jgi:hypothetical protein